jgi:hypothetical protein
MGTDTREEECLGRKIGYWRRIHHRTILTCRNDNRHNKENVLKHIKMRTPLYEVIKGYET